MASRKTIPPKLKEELLIEVNHACTICGRSPVQIHHIDGNPTRNTEDNLIVLCFNHHDEAERSKTSRGLSSNLSPAALLKYKRRLKMGGSPQRPESTSASNVSANIKNVRESNIIISGGDVINWDQDTQINKKIKDNPKRTNIEHQRYLETNRGIEDSNTEEAETAIEDHISGSGDLKNLYNILVIHFDKEELKTLCFKLGVDHDNLHSEGKANKARELVTFMKRHGRIRELEIEIVKERPHISLSENL